MLLTTSTVVLLAVIANVLGYETYQQKIPNVERVPHPCNKNNVWRGVGHYDERGGGLRNSFGLDFKALGYSWNSELCKKDSDGDGKTNGEELGDPECVWTKGMQPTRRTELSHPGICDQIDNPECNGKLGLLQCDDNFDCPAITEKGYFSHVITFYPLGICDQIDNPECNGKLGLLQCDDNFDCPAITEKDTFNFTVRLPDTPVPASTTTYMCYTFEFPSDVSHVVAYRPIIDNKYVMHHMAVFKCQDDTTIDNTPYVCGMTPGRGCSEVVAIWSFGMFGQCLHKDSGILIGGEKGIKKAAFQFHWNNPDKRGNESDSSGFTFYLTPKLRPYNSGIWTIGQMFLEIPPGQESYKAMGVCSSECTPFVFTDRITVTSVYNHMHYLGRSQMTELRRNGVFVTDLGNDTQYSYDYPVLYTFENGVDIYPGDELRTTCYFTSTSRETTTYYGYETKDEMCFSVMSYFPKENVKHGCTSWKNIGTCDWQGVGKVKGCDLTSLRPENFEMMQLISNVTKKCMPGLCKAECLIYVRDLKKIPCFVGDVDTYARYQILMGDPEDATFKTMSSFYAAFDSCDRELNDEQIEELKTAFRSETEKAGETCKADIALARENCCVENMCDEECTVNSAQIVLFNAFMIVTVTLNFWI